MKTATFGLVKPTHGINEVEGTTGGVPNEAANLDAIDAALVAAGTPTGAAIPTYATSGAITQKSGTVGIGSAGALTMTLANPVSGTDDGKRLSIVATTAHAHIVTTTAAINGGSNHKATFGGALGDQLNLVAIGGVWYQTPSTNITLAAS